MRMEDLDQSLQVMKPQGRTVVSTQGVMVHCGSRSLKVSVAISLMHVI